MKSSRHNDEEKLHIGQHSFKITGPKIEPFATNFFGWYGGLDLGQINLKRGMGTLNISVEPPVPTVTITGSEFSTNLANIGDINLAVPADTYAVQMQYPRWSQAENITVPVDQAAGWHLIEKFGALRLTCNKNGATYSLERNKQTMGSGSLPAVLDGLPIGNYQLIISYHQHSASKRVLVTMDKTNEAQSQFFLGALELETTPSGVSINTADGSYLGTTPLLLLDQTPLPTQFTLNLAGYEPMTITAVIIPDATNVCSTNLVGVRYTPALQEAKSYLAATNYSAAARAAGEALAAKPNDADALAVQSEANKHLAVELQTAERLRQPREVFDTLCDQTPDSGLFGGHEQKATLPAKAVTDAIIRSLQSEPHKFGIVSHDSPKPDVYEITARQTFSLGILGGTERDCLIVVGQAKLDDTEIYCKVLEYQVKSLIVANGFHLRDEKQKIPVSPRQMQMTETLRWQINDGLKIVGEKIEAAIQQVP